MIISETENIDIMASVQINLFVNCCIEWEFGKPAFIFLKKTYFANLEIYSQNSC